MDINKLDKRQLHELAKEYWNKCGRNFNIFNLQETIERYPDVINDENRYNKFLDFVEEKEINK